jgi:hypothetical protein
MLVYEVRRPTTTQQHTDDNGPAYDQGQQQNTDDNGPAYDPNIPSFDNVQI